MTAEGAADGDIALVAIDWPGKPPGSEVFGIPVGLAVDRAREYARECLSRQYGIAPTFGEVACNDWEEIND